MQACRNSGANNSGIATIKEVAGKTIFATPSGGKERHVNCQLRGCPRTESKSREVASQTIFWPASEGLVYGELMEHVEVVPHPKVLDEGDELARRFIIRSSARGLGRTCCF